MLKPGINKYIICGVAASVGVYSLNQVRTLEFTHIIGQDFGVYSLNQVRTLEFTHLIRSGLWSLLTLAGQDFGVYSLNQVMTGV